MQKSDSPAIFQTLTPDVKEALLQVNNHLITALKSLDEIASNYLPDPETAKEQVIAALKKLPIDNYSDIVKYS